MGSLTKSNNDLKVELDTEKALRESLEKAKQPDNDIVDDVQPLIQESSHHEQAKYRE